MALFDKDGNLNEQTASQIYQSATSQVTGDPAQYTPMGNIPMVGQPTDLTHFDALEPIQLGQLKQMAVQSLAQGFPPETQVSISLQAMAQLVRTLEIFGAFEEKEIESVDLEEEEG